MCGSLDALAAADLAALDDASLRDDLHNLSLMANRCHAEILRRVDAFDSRGLSVLDGFRTAKTWLIGALGIAPATAGRWVKAARLLRCLPKLAVAVQSGRVSPEHVQQVVRLADRVDPMRLTEIDPTLADAAQVLDVPQFGQVCQRAEAHLIPDGRDPGIDFERRGLTLSPAGELTMIRGLLDPEGAAAVQTALDAMTPPPCPDDTRSAPQRRADALVELARLPLAHGDLPAVGGQRPQVGVLLWPQALSPETLAALAQAQADQAAAARLRDLAGVPDPARDTGASPDSGGQQPTLDGYAPPGGQQQSPGGYAPPGEWQPTQEAAPGPVWSRAGWADPPQLSWVGPVPAEVAQRIACDADLFRVIIDPATSQPLDVGRAHRLVPYWIRRALYVRDRGCRWPGCQAPAQWTDAHHLDEWAAHKGDTKVNRLVLLCRFHHVLVHEGGWSIDLAAGAGEVRVTRPGAVPYRLPRGRSPAWTGPTTHQAF